MICRKWPFKTSVLPWTIHCFVGGRLFYWENYFKIWIVKSLLFGSQSFVSIMYLIARLQPSGIKGFFSCDPATSHDFIVLRHSYSLPRKASHSWRCQRPGWLGLQPAQSTGKCLCLQQASWNWAIFKVPSNPNLSIILHHPFNSLNLSFFDCPFEKEKLLYLFQIF